MIMIPMQSESHRSDKLIIILDEISMERLRQADPAEIILSQQSKHLVNPMILVCFEKDHKKLNCFIQAGDINGLIEYLQRGWKFRPELGDHDRGPESIISQN